MRQADPNNPPGVPGNVLSRVKAGTLTADELIKWLDKSFPGGNAGPMGITIRIWVVTTLLPLLRLIKAHDPKLFGKITYVSSPGAEAIGVSGSDGAEHVYPIQGVNDPSIKERVGDLINGVENLPVIKQTIQTGEFLFKLGQIILNPVRMGELVVGVLLVAVGVNAVLRNPAGKVASVATPVGRTMKAVRPAPIQTTTRTVRGTS